jgi:magnesium-transporting ATPase (P-type)
LKSRVAVPATRTMALDNIERFDGVIRCPPPNRDLYSFDARLWLSASPDHSLPAGDALPLSGEQLLQQATRLRNTDKIYGIAVYTGNETKFGMNKGNNITTVSQMPSCVIHCMDK